VQGDRRRAQRQGHAEPVDDDLRPVKRAG
jgi:hypothetical protein